MISYPIEQGGDNAKKTPGEPGSPIQRMGKAIRRIPKKHRPSDAPDRPGYGRNHQRPGRLPTRAATQPFATEEKSSFMSGLHARPRSPSEAGAHFLRLEDDRPARREVLVQDEDRAHNE